MARWKKGEQTVQFLISQGRLEIIEVADLAASADALITRAALSGVKALLAASPPERFSWPRWRGA